MPEATLILPFPPSVNHIWIHAKNGAVFLSKKARAFRETVAVETLVARSKKILPKEPIAGKIRVKAVFHAPDRRVRDLDNCHKALWDALTHAGVWLDDWQVEALEAAWGEPKKKSPCVEMTMTWGES